jgi:NADH-quinone oxidoreductase subunit L
MGGLKKFMPVTFATYAVGMMALAGVPLFFSGFWSKDEILHAAWLWAPSKRPFLLAAFGAFLTAFYMTRQMIYVFYGGYRGGVGTGQEHATVASQEAHAHAGSGAGLPHESPSVMTVPLAILAVCTIVLGAFGTPIFPWFHSYLSGHPTHFESRVDYGALATMLLSTLIVGTGIGLGWRVYGRRTAAAADALDPLEELKPDWFGVLRRKFLVDELYEISVIRLNAWCAKAARWLDEIVWDGAVRAVSYGVLGVSWLNRLIDEYVVNPGFDRGCGAVRLGGRLLSIWQNGRVQRYMRVIGLSLTLGASVFIWGCDR